MKNAAPPALQDALTGWKWDNSYQKLPEIFFSQCAPEKVRSPQLVIYNEALSHDLGLQVKHDSHQALAEFFSGNVLFSGTHPIALAYAGHQFGHLTMLGDGRAHLLSEHITPAKMRVDVQLKGSGKTPYSRRGDGRAALAPMLREYLISEAMHALGIPTTRSLCVVATGEPVYRETMLQGAVLARIASSHIRVGTFEYAAMRGNKEDVAALADYAIARHYPHIIHQNNKYAALLTAVINKHIALVVNWMRVGFIHGVMNTDNVSIAGETIDYGPCAFMDDYNPSAVFSAIDTQGRYSFSNQASITAWNMARFAESILPLLHPDIEEAVTVANDCLATFNQRFHSAWLNMMRKKLGLSGEDAADETLIAGLLQWMQRSKADYTNVFRDLSDAQIAHHPAYQSAEFQAWNALWQKRLAIDSRSTDAIRQEMQAHNPAYIPRNHLVEYALSEAQQADMSHYHELLRVMQTPYQHQPDQTHFSTPPTESERVINTYCGT